MIRCYLAKISQKRYKLHWFQYRNSYFEHPSVSENGTRSAKMACCYIYIYNCIQSHLFHWLASCGCRCDIRTEKGVLEFENSARITPRAAACRFHSGTRRSENDNTPQPLVQWTNSPFTGQQVGNCKSFTLTHYLTDLFVMLRGPRSIPLCIQHHIQLTSLSFQVSETSHCWVTAISIFNLENLRSMSWVRSKFEVTMWV